MVHSSRIPIRRKRLYGLHLLAAAGIASAVCAPAHGTIIASDDFQSYSPGALAGTSGGTGFGSNAWVTGTVAPSVVNTPTSLSYTVTNANSATVGSINGGTQALQFVNATNLNGTTSTTAGRSFAASSNADSVWARFLVRIDTGSVENSDFLTLYFGNSTSSPNFASFGSAAGDFTLRNGTSGLQTGGPEVGAGNIGVTTYLLVARISKDTPGAASPYNRAEMWINPVLTSSDFLPVPTLSGTFVSTQTSVGSLGARSANLDTSPVDSYLMDEVVYATTVGEAVPGAVGALPEPGSAMLAVAAMGLIMRRRPNRV